MKKFIRWIYFLLLILIVNSCENVTREQTLIKDCSIENQNRYVYNYMQDNYLWYKKMPKVNYKNYLSPEALLKDLRVDIDRWSFIINKEIFDNIFSGGTYIGYGFKKVWFDNKLYVAMVFPNSPASKAGLKRGMRILEINGVAVDNKNSQEINNLLGERKKGVSAIFKVKDENGIKDIKIIKDDVKFSSVIASKILEINGKSYGYLMFNSFIEPSYNELDEVFKNFKANSVDGVIIDLRYNGGGLIGVANYLGSLLIGNKFNKEPFFKLLFNDKKSAYKNSIYYLKNERNSLNIDEIYFITTNNSCSASEALINGVKAYVDVKVFGEKSCGKPVGMVGDAFCDKYLMPIEFKIVNKNSEGDYFNGLNVDCYVTENFRDDFGNLNEKMLNEVVYYIENRSCKNDLNLKVVNKVNNQTTVKAGLKAIFNMD